MKLTRGEYAVCEYLALHSGQTFSKEQISEAVFGFAAPGDPAAVTGVDVLEEKFGYSRSYLNRTFRQSTGVSIWEYVILKRLTCARAAIRAGTPAAIAARDVGYSDYSSFYRQYRKRFGCTPEEEKRGLTPDRKPDRKGGGMS